MDTGTLVPVSQDTGTLTSIQPDGDLGGLLVPSDTLYPGNALYPLAGQGIVPVGFNLGTLNPV